MILTALNGLCMAIADSVPGVSGGTVAFILGFYDRFIYALHDLFQRNPERRKDAFRYLIQLFIGWGPGMCACTLILSALFTQNIYFMSSLFLGLTAAAIPFILRAEQTSVLGHWKNIPFLMGGTALVVGLSLLRSGTGLLGTVDFYSLQPLHLVYILVSGMAAVSAMMLPGISGSTVLLIAGVYLPAINAFRQLLHFQLGGLAGLGALGAGVLLGAAVSIRLIRRALEHHRSAIVFFILGLMLGSLYAITLGPATLAQPLPALSIATFRPSGFLLGITVLLGLEYLKTAISGIRQDPESKETLSNGCCGNGMEHRYSGVSSQK